jgi:hypothetical protein
MHEVVITRVVAILVKLLLNPAKQSFQAQDILLVAI